MCPKLNNVSLFGAFNLLVLSSHSGGLTDTHSTHLYQATTSRMQAPMTWASPLQHAPSCATLTSNVHWCCCCRCLIRQWCRVCWHLSQANTCPQPPTPSDNGITDEGYKQLLMHACEGQYFEWIHDVAGFLKVETLVTAGLPPELRGKASNIVAFLREQHASAPHRRAGLVVLGPQGFGKTSLLWRLRNPSGGGGLPPFQSTEGIDTSEYNAHCGM